MESKDLGIVDGIRMDKPYLVLGIGHLGNSIVDDFEGRGYEKTGFFDHLPEIDDVTKVFEDEKKVIIFPCGLGGSSADEIIRLLEMMRDDRKCLTIGVLAKPFSLEGENRRKRSKSQSERLESLLDTMFVIDDDMLVPKEYELSLYELFARSDSAMEMVLTSLLDLLEQRGSVTPDLERLYGLLREGGMSFAGFGRCVEPSDMETACMTSLYSPLVKDMMDRAQTLILCMSGPTISLNDGQEMARLAKGIAKVGCRVLFSIDSTQQQTDEIWITSLLMNIGFCEEKVISSDSSDDYAKETVPKVEEESEPVESTTEKETMNDDGLVGGDDDVMETIDKSYTSVLQPPHEASDDSSGTPFGDDERISELETTLSERDDTIEDLRHMLEQAYVEMDALKRQVRTLEELDDDSSGDENERLRKENEDLEERCLLLERMIERLAMNHSRKTKTLERTISNLRKANFALKEMNGHAREKEVAEDMVKEEDDLTESIAMVSEHRPMVYDGSKLHVEDSDDAREEESGLDEEQVEHRIGEDSPPGHEPDSEEESSLVDELMELLD